MTLPQGWAEATLGDVADFIMGQAPPGDVCNTEGYGTPFVKAGEFGSPRPTIREWTTKPLKMAASTDVLICVVGATAGKLNLGADCAIGRSVAAIRPTGATSAAFIYPRLKSEVARLRSGSTGTAQGVISRDMLTEIALCLPPLAEQGRIVAKLDALTARLARARAELERVPDLSEKQHLAILRAGMRGELSAEWRSSNPAEPTSALLARIPAPQQGRGGREATHKVIPGVAGLAVNHPGTELPEGWAWVPLLRIAKQETGHTPSRSRPDYWDGGVPWIGIRDAGAHHGRYIEETIQTISEAGLANSSARLLPSGTVCLSRTASVGYVTIMARSMATSQDFATWTCSEALLPEYLMYALMAEGDEIRNFGMGTTHTTIYFPEVRAFHIALPPVEEQKEVVARIKAAIARADRLEAEAARARALLDRLETALLAKAFRGELVPQDPNDEPAQILLDRIRTQRAAAPKAKRERNAKVTA